MLPYSDNPKEILNLHLNSNVNHKGRYIFRIDEWIQPAGCKNEYSNGIFEFLIIHIVLFIVLNLIMKLF